MMKKNRIPYFVWALSLATTLFLSCSKDDASDPISGKQVTLSVSLTGISENDGTTEITRSVFQTVPVTETVTVPAGNGMTLEATLERSTPAATRGVTALAAGVKYRVIAFKQNDVGSSGYISYADYAVGTTGAIAGELHAPLGSSVTFVCYSLGKTTSLSAFNRNSLDVAANPATDDLLYAKFNQTITTESHSVSFTLKHQFSLVTVIADATSAGENISAISASLSPNYSAVLDVPEGTLTAGTEAARTIPWGTITAGQTVTATPCTVFTNGSDAVTVNIPSATIGGITKAGLTATFGSDVMLSGYKYTLRLNFKLKPYEGPVVAGLTWAPGNLIGTSNGDGTFNYAFAATQEYYSGVWNGGDYWNWCLLDYTNYKGNGTSYDYATNDPCRLVAPIGTWRMPTQTELTNLINSGYTASTTKNGINGRYFGTTVVPASNVAKYYLFLSTSGNHQNSSMTMANVGTIARYWCSVPYNGGRSYNLYFSDSVLPNVADSYMNTGFNIRCVK